MTDTPAFSVTLPVFHNWRLGNSKDRTNEAKLQLILGNFNEQDQRLLLVLTREQCDAMALGQIDPLLGEKTQSLLATLLLYTTIFKVIGPLLERRKSYYHLIDNNA